MKIIYFVQNKHLISNDTIVNSIIVSDTYNNLNLSIKFELKIPSHRNPQSGEGYQSICKNYPPRSCLKRIYRIFKQFTLCRMCLKM